MKEGFIDCGGFGFVYDAEDYGEEEIKKYNRLKHAMKSILICISVTSLIASIILFAIKHMYVPGVLVWYGCCLLIWLALSFLNFLEPMHYKLISWIYKYAGYYFTYEFIGNALVLKVYNSEREFVDLLNLEEVDNSSVYFERGADLTEKPVINVTQQYITLYS